VSRGPGKIERAIAALLDGNPDMAMTTAELVERVYGVVTIEMKHTVSVLRALRRLAQRRPDINETWGRDWQRHHKQGSAVWFNRRNARSYGMMMLKTRFCAYRIIDAEKQFLHNPPIPKVETEAALLAMLAPGGKYHGYVQPGGEWYRAVHGTAEASEAPAPEIVKHQRLLLKALVAMGDPGEDQAWSPWAVLNKAWHDPEFQGAVAERMRRWLPDAAESPGTKPPLTPNGTATGLDALMKEDHGEILLPGERGFARRQMRDEMKNALQTFALLEKRGLVKRWGSRGRVSVAITTAGRALVGEAGGPAPLRSSGGHPVLPGEGANHGTRPSV
jgi:hypothetical protein